MCLACGKVEPHLLCSVGDGCMHYGNEEECLKRCAPEVGREQPLAPHAMKAPWDNGKLSGVVDMDSWSNAQRMPHYTVRIQPMGKPRWKKSYRWLDNTPWTRYLAWKDDFKSQVDVDLINQLDVIEVSWKAFFLIPTSWSKKKREEMAGQPHRQVPDRDNMDKAILDTMVKDDAKVAWGSMEKYWDDGDGPRLELFVSWHKPRDRGQEAYKKSLKKE